MNIQQAPVNFRILSIFQLIFIQHNYRTVNFFTNHTSNDAFDEIIKISRNYLKPIKLINVEAISMNGDSVGGPILNIFIVNDLHMMQSLLMESYFYGTTVIWSTNEFEDDLSDTMISWLKVSSKVIVVTNSDIYALNNLVTASLSRLPLSNFSLASVNLFIKTFFSIESVKGSKLIVFTSFSAPRSDLTRIDDNYCFTGPDGITAEVLVKNLNLKPTFLSNIEVKHSSYYQDWLNSSMLSLKLRYQQFHSATLTNNIVTIFDYQNSKVFDLILTSVPIKRMNSSLDIIYPHGIDCLTAIVPQRHHSHDFFRKLMTNTITLCICITLLLFTLWRLLLQKNIWHNIFVILFHTIGVFLNQIRIQNDNRMGVVWDINLRVFSVLATTTLSAIVFRYLITTDHNEINTIDDLLKSNLTIYAPSYLQTQEVWQHIRPSLQSKINFREEDDIETYLVEEHKFNFAYIYFESKSGYIAMLANAKVPKGSTQWVRLMKEKIYCTPLSFRASKNSPLTSNINLFILKMLENGIYYKQMEWIGDLNEAVFATKRNEPEIRDNHVLTIKMIVDVFSMYLIGIGMASISFIVENLFGKTRKNCVYLREVLCFKK